MRTQLAVMLCSFLIITVINTGCCPKCPTIPQRCIVELPTEPIIDNEPCHNDDSACISKKNLKNYEAQKLYAETLRNNAGACR